MKTVPFKCDTFQHFLFRQRNEELEALNAERQQQMALLQSELERLRKDNVALYEKVRFLQSYSGQVKLHPCELEENDWLINKVM